MATQPKGELAVAYVSITPSFDGFRRDVEREVGASMRAAAPAAGRAGQQTGQSFATGLKGGLSGANAAFAAVGAGIAAVAGSEILQFGRDSLQAFAEAETAAVSLELAFEKFPALADTSQAALESLNAEMQRKAAIDGDSLNAADAVLARFGLTGQQISNLTPLLVDYATVAGVDATQGAETLGKALLGNARALKTLGIEFKPTGDRAKDLATLMGMLEEKVGGAGEKFAGTAAGSLKAFDLAIEDAKEVIGESLVPALESATGTIQALSPILPTLTTNLMGASAAMGQLASAASQLPISLPPWLSDIGSTALGAIANVGLGPAGAFLNGVTQGVAAQEAALRDLGFSLDRVSGQWIASQQTLAAMKEAGLDPANASIDQIRAALIAYRKAHPAAQGAVEDLADATDAEASATRRANGPLAAMERNLLGIGRAIGLIPTDAPWSTWEAFNARGQGDPNLRGYIRSESDQQAYEAAVADQEARDEQDAQDAADRRERLQAERAASDQARIDLERQFWSDERRARKERDEALRTLRQGPQSGEVFLANQRAYYEKEYAYRAAHRARLDAEARADQERADREAAEAERRAQEREEARRQAEEERRRAREDIRSTVNARTWLDDLIGGTAESATAALIDTLLPQVLATLPAGMGTGFAEWLQGQNARLSANIAARAEIAKQLDKANQDLAQAIAARDNAASSFAESAVGNITQWGKTPTSIKRWLTTRLAAMRTFASNLKALVARGLPLTFARQILAAGIDGGSQVAAALMRANDGDWAQIVAQATELETTADVLGRDLAGQLYQGAVDSAQAIVDGLESQKAALEAEARVIGESIRAGILAGLGGTVQVGISGGVTEGRPGRAREATPRATAYAAPQAKSFAPTVIVNNPAPEPTSTSLPSALRAAAWRMGA